LNPAACLAQHGRADEAAVLTQQKPETLDANFYACNTAKLCALPEDGDAPPLTLLLIERRLAKEYAHFKEDGDVNVGGAHATYTAIASMSGIDVSRRPRTYLVIPYLVYISVNWLSVMDAGRALKQGL
jgi:hypothetical protein